VPENPYVALWSRLARFDPADWPAIHPLTAPILARAFKSPWSAKLAGADLAQVVAFGRELLGERPRTRAELAVLLGPPWPEADAAALAHAVTFNSAPLSRARRRDARSTASPACRRTISRRSTRSPPSASGCSS
jgi:hypothetical protein